MNDRLRVIAGKHKNKLVDIHVNSDLARVPGDSMIADLAWDSILDQSAMVFEVYHYRRFLITDDRGREIHVLIPFEMTDAEGGAAYDAFIAGK